MHFSKVLMSLSLAGTIAGSVFSQASNKKTDFHQWAAAPPLGWNSWDCFGPTVVEDEVKANADYMAKNLKSSGEIIKIKTAVIHSAQKQQLSYKYEENSFKPVCDNSLYWVVSKFLKAMVPAAGKNLDGSTACRKRKIGRNGFWQ